VYVIHTYVHNVLVADSTGAFFGAVTPQQVQLQLTALNAAYNTSSQQAGVTWLYKLANITNTTITLGADMCNEQTEVELKKRLRQGDATALNLYVPDLSQCGVLGAASWPWETSGSSSSSNGSSTAAGSTSTSGIEGGSSATANNSSSSSSIARGLAFDGVTLHYDTLPLGELEGYNTGGTAIHEVGHWHGERCACAAQVAQPGCSMLPRHVVHTFGLLFCAALVDKTQHHTSPGRLSKWDVPLQWVSSQRALLTLTSCLPAVCRRAAACV
jgi:hypothetical protein